MNLQSIQVVSQFASFDLPVQTPTNKNHSTLITHFKIISIHSRGFLKKKINVRSHEELLMKTLKSPFYSSESPMREI